MKKKKKMIYTLNIKDLSSNRSVNVNASESKGDPYEATTQVVKDAIYRIAYKEQVKMDC